MNARDELTDFIGDLLHKAGVLDSLTDDEQAAPVHRKVDGLLNAASAEVRVEMTLANADWLEGIGQDHAASMLRYSLDLDAEMADAAEPGEKVTPTPAPAPVESAGDEAGEANGAVRFDGLPPAAKAPRHKALRHADVAAALKVKPFEWAVVKVAPSEKSARVTGGYIRRAMSPPYNPAGSFEAKYRNVDGEHRVYARYVGAGGAS